MSDPARIEDVAPLSMLHPDALAKLSEIASKTSAGILEVGPYIGGSTLALAIGNQRRVPHAVIEVGGAQDHPTLPSQDIVADWRANMERFGFSDAALMCQGWSYQRSVRSRAVSHLNGNIGLFFLDADGNIEPAMRAFAPHMNDDCILAIDDYLAPDAEDKAAKIQPWIDAQVRDGRLVDCELIGGTWFGRFADGKARLAAAQSTCFVQETGHAYLAYIEAGCAHDTTDRPQQSPLRLYENDKPLGPAHALHDEIRTLGNGRFSYWISAIPKVGCLFVSASDNTDPRTNGRSYAVDFGTPQRFLISEL